MAVSTNPRVAAARVWPGGWTRRCGRDRGARAIRRPLPAASEDAFAPDPALAASIVLVVAAFYFDRTLGKVVARRRTIQAEPADYTIIVKGLPPTAIGSPTVESLDAAIAPVESEFWYYLHDHEGNLHPARNGTEHEANRKKYNVY